jgi:hypothetical protein
MSMTDEQIKQLKDEIIQHTIKKTHMLYGAIGTIVISAALAWGSVVSVVGDLQKQIELSEKATDAKISQLRQERSEHYVTKSEFSKLSDQLSEVIKSQARIEGAMSVQKANK